MAVIYKAGNRSKEYRCPHYRAIAATEVATSPRNSSTTTSWHWRTLRLTIKSWDKWIEYSIPSLHGQCEAIVFAIKLRNGSCKLWTLSFDEVVSRPQRSRSEGWKFIAEWRRGSRMRFEDAWLGSNCAQYQGGRPDWPAGLEWQVYTSRIWSRVLNEFTRSVCNSMFSVNVYGQQSWLQELRDWEMSICARVWIAFPIPKLCPVLQQTGC